MHLLFIIGASPRTELGRQPPDIHSEDSREDAEVRWLHQTKPTVRPSRTASLSVFVLFLAALLVRLLFCLGHVCPSGEPSSSASLLCKRPQARYEKASDTAASRAGCPSRAPGGPVVDAVSESTVCSLPRGIDIQVICNLHKWALSDMSRAVLAGRALCVFIINKHKTKRGSTEKD